MNTFLTQTSSVRSSLNNAPYTLLLPCLYETSPTFSCKEFWNVLCPGDHVYICSIAGDCYGFLISFPYIINDRVFRQLVIMVGHTSTSVWNHGFLGCLTVCHVTDVVQVGFVWL